jgi:hypothetical protein
VVVAIWAIRGYNLANAGLTLLPCFPQVVLHNWHSEFQKWLPHMPDGAAGLSLRKVSSAMFWPRHLIAHHAVQPSHTPWPLP